MISCRYCFSHFKHTLRNLFDLAPRSKSHAFLLIFFQYLVTLPGILETPKKHRLYYFISSIICALCKHFAKYIICILFYGHNHLIELNLILWLHGFKSYNKSLRLYFHMHVFFTFICILFNRIMLSSRCFGKATCIIEYLRPDACNNVFTCLYLLKHDRIQKFKVTNLIPLKMFYMYIFSVILLIMSNLEASYCSPWTATILGV